MAIRTEAAPRLLATSIKGASAIFGALAKNSIEILAATVESTKPIAKTTKTHSTLVSSNSIPAITTTIAAAISNHALGSNSMRFATPSKPSLRSYT